MKRERVYKVNSFDKDGNYLHESTEFATSEKKAIQHHNQKLRTVETDEGLNTGIEFDEMATIAIELDD